MLNRVTLIATSLLRWFFGLLIFIFLGVSFLFLAPFLTAREVYPWSRFVMKIMVRVLGADVRSRGQFPTDGKGYIYMLNHVTFMDHFCICAVCPNFMVGLEKISNSKIPVYGRMARWWGNISVVRDDRDKAMEALAQAEELLGSGGSIAIAPEGTRTKTGKVGKFKKGGFHVAKNTGAKIVPISLLGMKEVNPDRKFLLKSGRVEIIFHPPIDSTLYEMDELMMRVREQICSGGLEAD